MQFENSMKPASPLVVDEVCDLLKGSVAEIFRTMLDIEAEEAPLLDFRRTDEPLVAGSIGFIGDLNGVVYIYVKEPFARTLACRMMGVAVADLQGDEIVNDAIGELSNIIVGAVKSRLCDAGTPCVLTIPSIVRGRSFGAEPTCSSKCRLFTVNCGGDHILVELLMDAFPGTSRLGRAR